MENRIRWTAEERAAIKAKYIELKKAGQVFTLAVRNAQESVLPLERRRNINTRNAAPWLDGKADQKVNKLLEQQQAQERAELEATALEQVRREAMKAEVLANLSVVELVEIIQRHVISTIDKAVERRFDATIKSGVMRDLLEHRALELATTPDAQRERPNLMRVLVVGLKGQQHEEIKRTFSSSLHIDTMTADRARTGGSWLPSAYDRVIVMTKFIDHAVEKRVRSQFGDKVIRHPHSIDTLKGLISKIAHGAEVH